MRWLSIVAAVGTGFFSALPALAATKCNGYEEFCNRTYSNVSVIGAHNSYGVLGSGVSAVLSVAANQNYSVTTQLNDGIRLLQVQGHMNNNTLHLCHTSCLILDAGPFETYLSEVKTWLDSNPREVITLILVNSDGIDPTVWAEAYSATGLDSLSYVPSSSPVAYDDWPTLSTLISSGKRVVNFLAQNADISSVDYLLDEFSNVWETPYDQTNNSFPCTVDRVTGSASNKMYLMNHFLDTNLTIAGTSVDIPDESALDQTNAATGTGSLGTQAATCLSEHNYYPTFTLVDYYDVGNVFKYAATINGVTYNASTSTASSSSSASSASSSVSSSSLNGAGALDISLPRTGAALLVTGLALLWR